MPIGVRGHIKFLLLTRTSSIAYYMRSDLTRRKLYLLPVQPRRMGSDPGFKNLPEPKDLHLREQGLGSCLQSLPTVCFCQCLTDQVSNQFYLAFSCFILLRDFLFPISTGLEPMPSNPIWLACSPPTPDV